MSEIKRYSFVRIVGKFHEQAHMEESNEGNWCAYSDHAAEIERLNNRIADLELELAQENASSRVYAKETDEYIAAKDAILSTLERENKEYQGEIIKMDAEIDALKYEIEQLHLDIKLGNEAADKFFSDMDELRDRNAALKREVSDLTKTLGDCYRHMNCLEMSLILPSSQHHCEMLFGDKENEK